MAWTPPFGYQTYKQKDLKKRYTNNMWIQKKLDLIYNDAFNKSRYEDAKPNACITFLTYYDNKNNKKVEKFYYQYEKITIARDIIDEADRKSTKHIYQLASVGNIKVNDRIVIGKSEFDIVEIHTMRKKDWQYCLVVTDI